MNDSQKITREQLLEECEKDALICLACKGSGWIAAHAMGVDEISCPKCNQKHLDIPVAPKPNVCSRCGGTGMISIGGGCMGYDDEVCPKCHGDPNCLSLKEVLESARNDVRNATNGSLVCNRCGASLCAEEWHDCGREYEWQRTHG